MTQFYSSMSVAAIGTVDEIVARQSTPRIAVETPFVLGQSDNNELVEGQYGVSTTIAHGLQNISGTIPPV